MKEKYKKSIIKTLFPSFQLLLSIFLKGSVGFINDSSNFLTNIHISIVDTL